MVTELQVQGRGGGGVEPWRSAPEVWCCPSYIRPICCAKAKIRAFFGAEFLHGPATRAPAGSTTPTALEALARTLACKRARTRQTGRCHAVSPDRRSGSAPGQ